MSDTVHGDELFTYAADGDLSAAVLARLAEMAEFDAGERVEVEITATPATVHLVPWRGMMPVDWRAVGFDPPRTGPTPDGLTRPAGKPYLVPADGFGGSAWRNLLTRWNRRPALAPVLGAHGIPTVLTEPVTGRVTTPNLLVAVSAEQPRVVAPVLLRFVRLAPPDLTHLMPWDGAEFERLSTVLRARSLAGFGS